MGRTFASASSEYGSIAAAAVTAYPATLSCWVRPTTTGAGQIFMAVGGAANASRVQLAIAPGAQAVAGAADTTGATVGSAISTATLSTGTWYHILGTFASSTARALFINGSADGTNTTAVTLGTLDTTYAAARNNSGTIVGYFNGSLAEGAVWDVELTAAEIASLAAGATPRLIRPASLRAYVPLFGQLSPEPNPIGLSMTLFNTPSTIDHPRIFF